MSYLDALEFELLGYERAGKTDRADQVRAEIARITGAATKRAATVAERGQAPRGRRSATKDKA